MKNLFVTLVLVISSLSLFSCTTDDSDLAQEEVILTETEIVIAGGTKQIRPGE